MYGGNEMATNRKQPESVKKRIEEHAAKARKVAAEREKRKKMTEAANRKARAQRRKGGK